MSIVKKAASAFQQGDFSSAEHLYQQAAERYGKHLFSANIALCQRALKPGSDLPQRLSGPGNIKPIDSNSEGAANSLVEQQLSETQKLLEHYFTRCQALEFQQSER